MKKTLLTLGAVLGVAAGAFGQGAIHIQTPNTPGFNTVSSNPNDSGAGGTFSDYINGTVSLQLFSQTTADANLASQSSAINSLAAAGNESGAAALLAADFTQQLWGPTLTSESQSLNFTASGGSINTTAEGSGDYAVGSSSTLTSGALGYYGLLATWVSGGKTYTGVIVADAGSPQQLGGGSNPASQLESTWPFQNILLEPVPEPTTLALAGLGGLSMLFLRRRKA